MNKRPIVVTILAILSGFFALMAILAALNWLGMVPWFGPGPAIRTFNLWYALLYGLLAWVYVWLTKMLWEVRQEAWLFLAVITFFNLTLDFITIVTSNMPITDRTTVSILLNSLVLIYIMLPSTQRAFGRK